MVENENPFGLNPTHIDLLRNLRYQHINVFLVGSHALAGLAQEAGLELPRERRGLSVTQPPEVIVGRGALEHLAGYLDRLSNPGGHGLMLFTQHLSSPARVSQTDTFKNMIEQHGTGTVTLRWTDSAPLIGEKPSSAGLSFKIIPPNDPGSYEDLFDDTKTVTVGGSPPLPLMVANPKGVRRATRNHFVEAACDWLEQALQQGTAQSPESGGTEPHLRSQPPGFRLEGQPQVKGLTHRPARRLLPGSSSPGR